MFFIFYDPVIKKPGYPLATLDDKCFSFFMIRQFNKRPDIVHFSQMPKNIFN